MIVAVLATHLLAGEDKVRRFRFTKDDVGNLPSGWTAAKTGKGEGSLWKVVSDDAAPSKTGYVLAQTAEGPKELFNLCVVDDTSYKDVEVRVAFKAVRGKNDQGGGVVWRYKDSNNYYIARMNPLEDNYRLYKVVKGKRQQLATQEDLKVAAGEWRVLKIDHSENHIQCYLDGTKYLDVYDSTFKDAGKIGLWSKSDAQTYFDDLQVREQ